MQSLINGGSLNYNVVGKVNDPHSVTLALHTRDPASPYLLLRRPLYLRLGPPPRRPPP